MDSDDLTFITRSHSSDSVNTIVHREFQRRHIREFETSSSSFSQKNAWGCFDCGSDPSLVLEPHVPNMMNHVVIIGAGAIGGFIGCCLFQGGGDAQVTFLVRNPQHISRFALVGFQAHSTVDLDFRARIPPKDIRRVFTADPSCLREASCVLVATKRTATEEVHRMLCQQRVKCPVVFLQSGMDIRTELMEITHEMTGEKLGVQYEVIESIVMMHVEFNKDTGIVTMGQPVKDAFVVLDGHQKSAKAIANMFQNTAIRFQVEEKNDFINLQAAKIQISMINAINALNGATVQATLKDHGYRLVLADCIDECRAVFSAHHMQLDAMRDDLTNLRLAYLSSLLRTWNVVFMPIMGSKIELLKGRTSMTQDLNNNAQSTEIDYLNGVVVQLGRLAGVQTPINKKIVELVKRAEALHMGSPKLSSQTLLAEVGLIRPSYPVGGPEGDAANLIVSFDSLRRDSIDDSIPYNNSAAQESLSSSSSLGQRVNETLAVAMLSSEDLSFVASPPLSPVKAGVLSPVMASPRRFGIKQEVTASPVGNLPLWD